MSISRSDLRCLFGGRSGGCQLSSSSVSSSRGRRRLTPFSRVARTSSGCGPGLSAAGEAAGEAAEDGECMFKCPTIDSAPIRLEDLTAWLPRSGWLAVIGDRCGADGGGIWFGIVLPAMVSDGEDAPWIRDCSRSGSLWVVYRDSYEVSDCMSR